MTSTNEFADAFSPAYDGPRELSPASFSPVWLAPADVKTWLRLNEQDTSDDQLLATVCSSTEPYVQRCRPEWFTQDSAGTTTTTYVPDAETYHGAVMYAAREYRRRNSPAGIEMFGEATSFVARFDPDIERALQTGAFAPPVIS